MNNTPSSSQPIALVTGATGNLGIAVVQTFLNAGYRVIGITAPGYQLPADSTHDNYVLLQADLTDEENTSLLIRNIIGEYGKIDVTVLTAGGFTMGGISDTTATDIRRQYSLNFETAYHVARPVYMSMQKHGSGRIFFIGSKAGLDPHFATGVTAYSLSKSLLFRLAQLINDEAKGTDISAAVVVPSLIDTPQNRQAMPDADFSKWVSPDAIAHIILWHCSEAAKAVREPVIKVYGQS